MNGMLFPPGDDETLAAAIGRLVEDEDERRRMGQAARQTVVESYGLDRVAERYLELYAEMTGTTHAEFAGGVVAG